MILFLFRYIEQVSDSYHSGGGLVIVAEDEERARALIADEEYIKPTDGDWAYVIQYELMPGHSYQPVVYVFRDAGCC